MTINSRYHLGHNLGHERSAAIVRDGKIEVAIEQERLDRNKFSLGYLLQSPGQPEHMQIPLEAIRYCLEACQVRFTDLATITANMPGDDKAPEILNRSLPSEVCDRIQQIPSHHLAHAYSAYSPSGFDEALVWVADASGSTHNHRTESYSLYLGQGSTLTNLHTETVEAHLSGISTLGFLYEYITKEAGFVTQVSDRIKHAEAGKLMGLAPFGGPQTQWNRWINTQPDSYSLEISPYDIFLEVEAIKQRYGSAYGSHEGKPYLREHIVDLAYKVQQELEQALLHVVGLALERTGAKRLCIAGGVGLNSVANYQLLQQLNLEDIFVFPAAGDSGIAAGCAYWAYHTIEGADHREPLRKADLGRAYAEAEMESAIAQFSDQVQVTPLSEEAMLEQTATALSEGSIVARYEGGAEFGPRALGQRSIMGDPSFLKMKDIINARVKFREAFRPFAPVIPLEAMAEVFEQEVAAPFMLLVANIKAEFQAQIPSVTHVDGTGRVQSVTAEDNPFFHQLCHRLVSKRSGPPVLLNTSFNVAGQPIVETPAEAIATFLNTDIDFLALGNYWLAKQHVPVLDYASHLSKVKPSPTPKGLGTEAPSVMKLMRSLDRAMFFGDDVHCPWSPADVKQLANKIAHMKETSRLFPEHPYPGTLKTRLADDVILLLNPQAQSSIVHLNHPQCTGHYNPEQINLLMACLQAELRALDSVRIQMRLTHREFQTHVQWAAQELANYHLEPKNLAFSSLAPSNLTVQTQAPDSPLGHHFDNSFTKTFEGFQDPDFSARECLASFYNILKAASYSAGEICDRLSLSSLQQIQPTHLPYYHGHLLSDDPISDFIRLFQLRIALPQTRIIQLLGESLFHALCKMGLFIPRKEHIQTQTQEQAQRFWASRIDLFDVEGLFIATDHRYMLLAEDKTLDESPIMYIGMDSMGLVYSAPQYDSDQLLDLCCGSGIQGLHASRYARSVIGVDINPRAIRFSRFNAQLNGINNIEFRQGNLYDTVSQERFNTILANPPFVPSPTRDFKFRDGGANGEEILQSIIQGSAAHLMPRGRVHIVTDLVDVDTYEPKLSEWWQGEATEQLVLGTADRNDILFSVPHSHAAFDQSYAQYCEALEQWLQNFHNAQLTAVNFGYIFIQHNPNAANNTYHYRTIHNPEAPIHTAVKAHFQQRHYLSNPRELQLRLHPDISIRTEWYQGQSRVELFSNNNPYFTTYPISEKVFAMLQDIMGMQPRWKNYVNLSNQRFIQELILKGILELQPASSSQPVGTQLVPIGLAASEGLATLPTAQHFEQQEENALSIGELQTKTTPTCLSSYL
ncbi:MAG: carbamoyltransferase C-terminal domain-containing protein [Cyanobacteria bacterium P01_F01_bin.53]